MQDHPIVGGILDIDHQGTITMQFNTEGMARAAADSNGLHLIETGK